jgi:hypothetical protein
MSNYIDSLPTSVREQLAQLIGRPAFEEAKRAAEKGAKLTRKKNHLKKKHAAAKSPQERNAIAAHGLTTLDKLDDVALEFIQKKKTVQLAKRIRKGKLSK